MTTMICLLVIIQNSHSFIAFHGLYVVLCFNSLLRKVDTSCGADYHNGGFFFFFCVGHIRRRWIFSSSDSILLPCWFSFQPRMFWYLAHRPYRARCPRPNISSWLIHVQAEVSLSYDWGGSTTTVLSEVWSGCYRKREITILKLTCWDHLYENWTSTVFSLCGCASAK